MSSRPRRTTRTAAAVATAANEELANAEVSSTTGVTANASTAAAPAPIAKPAKRGGRKTPTTESTVPQTVPAPTTATRSRRGQKQTAVEESVSEAGDIPSEPILEATTAPKTPAKRAPAKRGVAASKVVKVVESADKEVDEPTELVKKQAPKRGGRTATRKVSEDSVEAAPAPKRAGRGRKISEEEIHDEPNPAPPTISKAPTRKGGRATTGAVAEESIPPQPVPAAPTSSRGGRRGKKETTEESEADVAPVVDAKPTPAKRAAPKRGASTKAPKYMEVDDDELDEIVSEPKPAATKRGGRVRKVSESQDEAPPPAQVAKTPARRGGRKPAAAATEEKAQSKPVPAPTTASRSRRGQKQTLEEPVSEAGNVPNASVLETTASAAKTPAKRAPAMRGAAAKTAKTAAELETKKPATKRGGRTRKVSEDTKEKTASTIDSTADSTPAALTENADKLNEKPPAVIESTSTEPDRNNNDEPDHAERKRKISTDEVPTEKRAKVDEAPLPSADASESAAPSTQPIHEKRIEESKAVQEPMVLGSSQSIPQSKINEDEPMVQDNDATILETTDQEIKSPVEQIDETIVEETYEAIPESKPQLKENNSQLDAEQEEVQMETSALSESAQIVSEETFIIPAPQTSATTSTGQTVTEEEGIVEEPSELESSMKEEKEAEDAEREEQELKVETTPPQENGTTAQVIPENSTDPIGIVEEPTSPEQPDRNNNDELDVHGERKRKISVEENEYENKVKRTRFQGDTGDLFTLGDELVGEMGPREKLYKDLKVKKNQPGRVKLPDKIRQVAVGAYHTLVITEQGNLLTFGCNDDASLGRNTTKPRDIKPDDESDEEESEEDYEERMVKKPLPVEGDIKARVVKVSAGDMHSAALDENGNVFIWGNLKDESNKIGLFVDDPKEGSDCLPTKLPTQIDLGNKKVIDIASGCHHFLMLTADGLLYSMGEGSKGQLGRVATDDLNSIKTKRELFMKPQQVIFPESVSIDRIFASQWSSYALSTQGKLFAWGLNNYFQLGFRSQPISNNQSMDQSSNDIDNSVNGAMQLLLEVYPAEVPTPATMAEVVAVSSGQQHLLVLDIDGQVFTCGSALYGKLGHGKKFIDECGDGACTSELKQIDPEKFVNDRITYIEAGDFSSFAITETGRLYSWGQGSLHIGTKDDIDLFEPTLVTSAYADDVRFLTGASGPQYSGWIGSLKSTCAAGTVNTNNGAN